MQDNLARSTTPVSLDTRENPDGTFVYTMQRSEDTFAGIETLLPVRFRSLFGPGANSVVVVLDFLDGRFTIGAQASFRTPQITSPRQKYTYELTIAPVSRLVIDRLPDAIIPVKLRYGFTIQVADPGSTFGMTIIPITGTNFSLPDISRIFQEVQPVIR